MAFCKKCGAYIPIDETVCPACGYDPDEEARKAKEAEEAARRAEEEKKRAEEEERKRKEKEAAWAERERRREEEERRRAEERRKQGYAYGAAQAQYTSQHTGQGSAYQSQQTSQHTGQTWTPPWSQQQSASGAQQSQTDYSAMQQQAKESVDNQKLSVLSYLGPLLVIPLLSRSDDDFARFHTNQGLALFITNALVGLAGEMLGGLVGAAGSVFGLYCMIKGISNVLKGKKEPLPLIGNFKFLK